MLRQETWSFPRARCAADHCSQKRKEHMSRTIKAIERHMILPSKREAVEPHAPKLVGEWQQRGPETFPGYALRKLRLDFAPSSSTRLATVNRRAAMSSTIEAIMKHTGAIPEKDSSA